MLHNASKARQHKGQLLVSVPIPPESDEFLKKHPSSCGGDEGIFNLFNVTQSAIP